VTALDAADLVVIAGRTLGISTDAVLAQMDIAAAQDALAEARPPGQEPGASFPDRAAAAAAGIGLVRALLRHRPFPLHGQQVAVAAGLQFLSLNGWRADLDPAPSVAVSAVRQSPGPEAVPAGNPAPSANLAYAACMRSHGVASFPYPSASGVAVIAPAAGIDPNSPQFRSAEAACRLAVPAAAVHVVEAVPLDHGGDAKLRWPRPGSYTCAVEGGSTRPTGRRRRWRPLGRV
jgi:hypothetical protein